jgi:hypothetical protein
MFPAGGHFAVFTHLRDFDSPPGQDREKNSRQNTAPVTRREQKDSQSICRFRVPNPTIGILHVKNRQALLVCGCNRID